ncbi:hypothetical protein PENTCL1PPCAC_16917, partial [Pristionchus entomophagus]
CRHVLPFPPECVSFAIFEVKIAQFVPVEHVSRSKSLITLFEYVFVDLLCRVGLVNVSIKASKHIL